MEEKLKGLLREGIEICSPGTESAKLERLYDEITLFNPAYKLVAASGEELVRRHILDCLAPVTIIREYICSIENPHGADLGSGSGLPGLVLASAMEDVHFTLVERMGRRAGFLRSTSALCALKENTRVLEKDLAEVNESFDFVVFRAFRPLKDIITDLRRIVRSYVFIYKSSDENIKAEIEAAGDEFECTVRSYTVPFLEAERNLLILKRK
ncbi:MAG: class I SAM-dependent methyltransferase [Sphaerochaetaceae bacterium]|nr:class I SAM-dependent methyltransferase [Sphaerochaetaceae bacterium]